MDYLSLPKKEYIVKRERYDYGPFPAAYYYSDWVTDRARKLFGARIGAGIQVSVGSYQGGKERALMATVSDWRKLVASIVKKISQNPDFVRGLHTRSRSIVKKWSGFLDEIESGAKKLTTPSKIIETHRRWIFYYTEFSFWNCLLWFAGADGALEFVRKIIMDRYKVTEHEFHILTTPRDSSYVFTEECELLSVSTKVNFRAPLKRQLLSVRRALSDHAKRWQFVPWDYIGPEVWDVEKMFSKLLELVKSGREAKKLLVERSAYSRLLADTQERLAKRYGITGEHQRLISDIQTITHMQDEKKEICTRAQCVLHRYIFTAIAERLCLEPVLCSKFSERELWRALKSGSGKTLKKVLPERLAAICTVTDAKGIHVFSGERAAKFYKKFSESASDAKEFRGKTVSLGMARGRARVLKNPADMGKVEKGDILVTTMTTPDYLPAMKKAAAIVTEEGGLTSHAAIISRELHIPCIVGVKGAIQVFKDGDVLEVDAERGVVSILKKANEK